MLLRKALLMLAVIQQGVYASAQIASTQSAPSPTPLQVPAALLAGHLLHDPSPKYPKDAKRDHVTGSVVLRAVISEEGKISQLSVVSSPDDRLSESSLEAVSQWTYTPYLLNGVPSAVDTTITVTFAMGTQPGERVVLLKNSDGGDAGKVTLTQAKRGVELRVQLKNMPIGDHAVHIHMNAICDAPDFNGAGGHFNPDGKQHGFENPMGHHAGDTPGNVTVGQDHTGDAKFLLVALTMQPGQSNSVPGAGISLVVHERADDQKTDPSGASGKRIACGVLKN